LKIRKAIVKKKKINVAQAQAQAQPQYISIHVSHSIHSVSRSQRKVGNHGQTQVRDIFNSIVSTFSSKKQYCINMEEVYLEIMHTKESLPHYNQMS